MESRQFGRVPHARKRACIRGLLSSVLQHDPSLSNKEKLVSQRDLPSEIHALSMRLRIHGIALRELLRSLPKRRAAQYRVRLQSSLESGLLEVDCGPISDEADQAIAVELAEMLAIVSPGDR
jgi:hypothetical protein